MIMRIIYVSSFEVVKLNNRNNIYPINKISNFFCLIYNKILLGTNSNE